MVEPQHFIVASAGHVDHGKSALVKALTGTDPDRLPEEKARGITIDLGFAHLELPASAPGGSSFQLGIVDVPGHEDFVKNMVAGVGSIDVALFVVAADDGWMPQTEEHLQILSYLGVDRAVVALTKVDLTEDERRAVDAIHEKLRKARRLLPTLEYFAQELKRDHETQMDLLRRAKPGSQQSQIASEAMEMVVKDLEDRLPSEFLLNEAEPLSLDAAMAFINNSPTLPD